MLDDDLGDLWDPAQLGAGQPLAYRQGVIVSYDQVTGQNTVRVGGALLTDLPVLGVAEAATYSAGAAVGISSIGRQMFIVGRIVRPNTSDYTDAVNRLSNSILSASIATGESTANTTYTDLATIGPRVQPTVKSSGRLLVLFSASILGIDDATGAQGGAMGIEVRDSTGAVLFLPANLPELTMIYTDNAVHTLGDVMAATRTALLEGLTPGVYTITAKYEAGSGGNTAQFANRNVTAISL